LTGDDWFRRQSHVYLAGIFHNSEIWESQIKTAQHFRNFLGLTCLHDGPYMAIYECFESFAALGDYLEIAGEDIEPSLQILISDYNRYGLDRAWFYYPDALPADVLSDKVRNGQLDRKLSFPLEDLYGDGQPCGQVGQEIYGCGAAFIYASRAFHRRKDMPFDLFCDRRVRTLSVAEGVATLVVDNPVDCPARVVLRRKKSAKPKIFDVETDYGPCPALVQTRDRVEYETPAGAIAVSIGWRADA
jgi:hypothetical protein